MIDKEVPIVISYSAARPNSLAHSDLPLAPVTPKYPALRSGQPVFITCGPVVERATFLRYKYGRCTVALGKGGITINRSRVFTTERDAMEQIPAASIARMKQLQNEHKQQLSERESLVHSNFIWGMEEPYEPEGDFGYSPVSDHRDQAWRYNPIDVPGDGWARNDSGRARNAIGSRTARNGEW